VGPARPVPGEQIRDALGEPSLITNLPPEPWPRRRADVLSRPHEPGLLRPALRL